MDIQIAPSILAADFANLGADIKAVEQAGADLLHVDVMDANFVPNISIGPSVIKSIRSHTDLIFDVHLMIEEPHRYVESFAAAGADWITIHPEASSDTAETLQTIRSLGKKTGVSLKPATSLDEIAEHLELIDLILIMTVEPGFGGQSFMSDMLEKVKAARELIGASGRAINLEVDGGIKADTAPQVIAAGANVLVSGTGIFGFDQSDYGTAISALRNA